MADTRDPAETPIPPPAQGATVNDDATAPGAAVATAPEDHVERTVVRTAAQRRQLRMLLIIFLGPAAFILLALVVYPIIYSIWRSLFDASGDTFVGAGNYVELFTDPATFGAVKNNFIWVLVAPLTCTVLGLIFAVLMEKIRWRTAFKLIIFLPMAISMLAAGVIFRQVFQEDPNTGLANAVTAKIQDIFTNQGSYPGARPRPDVGIETADAGAIRTIEAVPAGTSVNFPLLAIKPAALDESMPDAVAPENPEADAISGTVWFDFIRGGGGEPGQINPGKVGLGSMTVYALDASGKQVARATTAADGTFVLSGLEPGQQYVISLPEKNFSAASRGISWLGPDLITPVIILSYVWIWAGFAMVMIASGLSAVDRSLMEAARTDGANEWQVFRHITVPQLAPVLMVVLVTLIINVLKIFDLVYVIPPGSSKPAANVIATQMWQVSFGGGNNQGLGSALAIFLLVLVLPAMLINIRNFKKGGQA